MAFYLAVSLAFLNAMLLIQKYGRVSLGEPDPIIRAIEITLAIFAILYATIRLFQLTLGEK